MLIPLKKLPQTGHHSTLCTYARHLRATIGLGMLVERNGPLCGCDSLFFFLVYFWLKESTTSTMKFVQSNIKIVEPTHEAHNGEV
jgi:hypothetical protein